MNTKIKAKWTKALRSGEFKQGRHCLRSHDNTFCCLGVLSELAAWEGVIPPPDATVSYRYDGSQFMPSGTVKEWAGITSNECNILVDMNDDNESFAKIADYIESNL